MHVLSAIRRKHKVSLPKVRASVDYVKRKLGSERPLLDRDFKTNGIDCFHPASTLLKSRARDKNARGELNTLRGQRDRSAPRSVFPHSRSSMADKNQPKTVVIDPRLAFGRPVISEVAVPTAIIIDRFRAGDSVTEMAGDYGVGKEEIEEALRFEQRLAA